MAGRRVIIIGMTINRHRGCVLVQSTHGKATEPETLLVVCINLLFYRLERYKVGWGSIPIDMSGCILRRRVEAVSWCPRARVATVGAHCSERVEKVEIESAESTDRSLFVAKTDEN